MQTLNRLVFKATREPSQNIITLRNYELHLESESNRGFCYSLFKNGTRIAQWKWEADKQFTSISLFRRNSTPPTLQSDLTEAIRKAGFWTFHSQVEVC
ncbi:hypothetical protein [Roseivirga spongicola]|uniref:Uncharacterized protein n=1 Tax=Roseivirga spongicola TaxID=333140 RepID=A0A150XCE6_9BACT|nr:hypothetical protein [Roseivirga spongicola]KYG76407.1 hypothetical protein AWW68_19365 [Roseivirga spongicola]WPZ08725.1 hypothetical protein T7867_10695 [Roseivirga spongicola]